LAKQCFTLVAKYKGQGTSGKTYINDEVYDIAMQKSNDRSSLSLIHYIKQQVTDGVTEDTHEPSKTHTDTGVLTLIVCASVPGLQVQDRVTEDFLEVEKLVEPREHIFCILGRKTEIFGQTTPAIFTPTVHRVCLPFGVERYSLLFFMDVPV